MVHLYLVCKDTFERSGNSYFDPSTNAGGYDKSQQMVVQGQNVFLFHNVELESMFPFVVELLVKCGLTLLLAPLLSLQVVLISWLIIR